MGTSAFRTPVYAACLTAVLAAILTGCGGGSGTSSPPATTTVATTAAAETTSAATTSSAKAATTDPCSLLTDAEVRKLEPSLAHGKLETIAGTQICVWANANGIPAVQLQVTTAPSSSLKKELANLNAGNNGYTIVAVAGIGDEAAAAFQKADASMGLKAGLATISVRSGGRVVSISTPLVPVPQGSQSFAVAKQLASTAVSRLPAG